MHYNTLHGSVPWSNKPSHCNALKLHISHYLLHCSLHIVHCVTKSAMAKQTNYIAMHCTLHTLYCTSKLHYTAPWKILNLSNVLFCQSFRQHQILCYGVVVVIRRHHCGHIIHRNVCTAHFVQFAVWAVCAVQCSVQWVQCWECIRGHYCGHLIHRNMCCLHAPLSQQIL